MELQDTQSVILRVTKITIPTKYIMDLVCKTDDRVKEIDKTHWIFVAIFKTTINFVKQTNTIWLYMSVNVMAVSTPTSVGFTQALPNEYTNTQ